MNRKYLPPLPALRPLDYLPVWQGIAIGVGIGLLSGTAVALGLPLIAAVTGFVLLLLAAVWLASSGEAIAVLEPVINNPPAAEEKPPTPPKPPDEGKRQATVRLLEMRTIPAGTFQMGDAEDGPIHEVRISSFECAKYPVTRQLYRTVMGEDPGWPKKEPPAELRPVNNVTWFDAVRFCNALSERERLPVCYRFLDDEIVQWDRTATGYRLLTEAEWEYACRAGSQTSYCYGDNADELERYAWYKKNANGEPQPVAQKWPNAWGLYDMHGNVWEWCWDWYGKYPDKPQTDPAGPDKGSDHVLRGGAFNNPAENLRSAIRSWIIPVDRSRNYGFRCARGPRRQP